MNLQEFLKIPNVSQTTIIGNTIQESKTGERQAHSIQTIIAQNRDLAVGCRMLGRGYITHNGKDYSGKDIADVYIKSVEKYGCTYFPLTGSWERTGIKKLILFVKNNDGKYIPYATFDISNIFQAESFQKKFDDYCIVPEFHKNFRYKSILEIKEEKEKSKDNPTTYLGVSSGKDIYECAFRGSAPNILII